MSQARGLTVFISDLRNCANPEAEKKRVEKEMAHIRSKFTSDAHMNGACARWLLLRAVRRRGGA
jgi:hypothetical protein